MTLIVQEVQYPSITKFGVRLFIARADLIHPLASGNKIYKLLPNIKYAKGNNYSELLSFGGAFSNHIHALALMSEKLGLKSIGIIRGEETNRNNPTLTDVQKAGMHLEFVSRQDYKLRDDKNYLQSLQQRFPNALIIPEGGSSQYAISGCAQLAKEINEVQRQDITQSDVITVASGTGATVAGLLCGASKRQTVTAYAVLRDESLMSRVKEFIRSEIKISNDMFDNLKIEKADFGGYAKLDKSHLDFIFDWLEQTGILLDPIYTSKMCRKLIQQIEAGEFKAGTIITMVHSGGLQGWRGMKARVIKLVGEEKWLLLEKHL